MDGFHYASAGGGIEIWNQEVGYLELPPGEYLVFAKVHIAIGYASSDPIATAYQATLEAAGIKDDMIGSLRYDWDDPGSRFESLTLNVGVKESKKFRATLTISATTAGKLYAFNPRLSAIQVSHLHSMPTIQGASASERQDLESRLIAITALAGFPIPATP